MKWLHVHDLLSEQIKREFPHSDVRPYEKEVRAAKDWDSIEKLLRRAEKQSCRRIDAAIAEFIAEGTWPIRLTDKERMID